MSPHRSPKTESVRNTEVTAFWRQPAAERTLRQAARQGRLSSSFLFAGPEGVGKWAAALWVAQALLCRQMDNGEPCGECRDCTRVTALTHPDLHLLFPVPGKPREEQEDPSEEGERVRPNTALEFFNEFLEAKRSDAFAVVKAARKPTIKLPDIRGLLSELSRTSVEGGAKVVIIHSADQVASIAYQSIMLKSIEEPPPDAHFILTSASPERLLPTIHSRCQTVRFTAVDPGIIAERLMRELGTDAEQAKVIAQLSGGGWGNAVRLAAEEHQAWRTLMIEFWNGAFRSRPHEMLAQIDPTFRPGKKAAGFDALIQAFDIWAYCLWRDCQSLCGETAKSERGAPIPDLETGWACWRILQNGRSTLYVNVTDRLAIAGTFLALRRRLRL